MQLKLIWCLVNHGGDGEEVEAEDDVLLAAADVAQQGVVHVDAEPFEQRQVAGARDVEVAPLHLRRLYFS